jgi:excinuclease ABC subunit C
MPRLDPATQLETLPTTPGVYRMLDAQERLLYVGKAKNLKKRVRNYFEGRHHGAHISRMVEQIAAVDWIATPSEAEALLLEQRLISQDKPKYNIIFRDDKTYAYVEISGHKFPRLAFHRGKKAAKSRLFGPFTDGAAIRANIDLVQKAFQLRTCQDAVFSNRTRPCMLHQIGRCLAPCVGKADAAQYGAAVERAIGFLSGDDKSLIERLTAEMDEASEALEFERAAKLRDQIQLVSGARGRQSIEARSAKTLDAIAIRIEGTEGAANCLMARNGVVSGNVTERFKLPAGADAREALDAFLSAHYADAFVPARLLVPHAPSDAVAEALAARSGGPIEWVSEPRGIERDWAHMSEANAQAALAQELGQLALWRQRQSDLERLLGLEGLDWIEAYDMSHHQGEGAVGAQVVYRDGQMRPKEYRLYKLAEENAGDDYASMKETIIRRCQGADELPRLFLIDGGAGQVKKAQEALDLLNLSVPLVGVSKGPARKVGEETLVLGWSGEEIKPGRQSPALMLIAAIRDEAHRFGITRNRRLLAKKRSMSRLERVEGIGPSKRRALLLRFGSAQGVADASLAELRGVPGISEALAERLKKELSG